MKRIACLNCRKKKVKCDGKHPCSQCYQRSMTSECEYTEPKKRGPKLGLLKQLKEENEKLKSVVLTQIETLPSFREEQTTLQLLEDFEDDSSKHKLFFHIYFNYINTVMPMIEQERYNQMESRIQNKDENISANEIRSHKLQTYGILAIISQLSQQFDQAEKYIDLARSLATELYDQPSVEVISGLALLSYYFYGIGEKKKGGLNIVLANHMCAIIDSVPHNLREACEVLSFHLVSTETAFKFSFNPDQIEENYNSRDQAMSAFLNILIYVTKRLLERKHVFKEQKNLQNYLEKASTIQEKFRLGGQMAFSLQVVLYGIKAWFHKTVGNVPEAREYANLATCSVLNELNIFSCPFVASTCLHVAKIHLDYGQTAMYALELEVLEELSKRWTFIKNAVSRLQKIESSTLVRELESSPLNIDCSLKIPIREEETTELNMEDVESFFSPPISKNDSSIDLLSIIEDNAIENNSNISELENLTS